MTKKFVILLSIIFVFQIIVFVDDSHANAKKDDWVVREKHPPKSRDSFILTKSGRITSAIAKGIVVPESQDDWVITDTEVTKAANDSSGKLRWVYHNDTDSYDVYLHYTDGMAVVNNKSGIISRDFYYKDSAVRKTLVQWYKEGSSAYRKNYRGDVTLFHEDGKLDKRITTRMKSDGKLNYAFHQIIYGDDGNQIGQEYHPATAEEIKLYGRYIKEKGWAK